MWVHRNADGPAIKNAQICKRPRRMIFTDQRNAVAKLDAFLSRDRQAIERMRLSDSPKV